jgi:hypothetical protein
MATKGPPTPGKNMPVGLVFGRLTVTDSWRIVTRPTGKRERKWCCVCECGNTVEAYLHEMKHGKVQSCGCLRREEMQNKMRTHGLASKDGIRSKTYSVWATMKQRCTNPKSKSYKNYGGRGITLDTTWHAFEVFLEDMGEAPLGYSIERIDNNKGYCKENCKWIPRGHQSRNTRKSIKVVIDTTSYLLCDALTKLGLHNAHLRYVMQRDNLDHQQGIDLLWQTKKNQK